MHVFISGGCIRHSCHSYETIKWNEYPVADIAMQQPLLWKSAELHQAYKTQDRLTGLGRSIKVFVIGEIEQLNTKWKEFRK
jgi:hypothetical protein